MRAIAGAAVIVQSSEILARLNRIEQRFAQLPAIEPPRQLMAAS
jgi:hypothetical protein